MAGLFGVAFKLTFKLIVKMIAHGMALRHYPSPAEMPVGDPLTMQLTVMPLRYRHAAILCLQRITGVLHRAQMTSTY